MDSKADQPEHIGQYIKAHILPNDLTVKAAAEVLGVSRPTLSNLLNGKASLSTDMALRLQRAFGANSEDLLKKQAAIENAQSRDREAAIPVRTYARSFLQIRAHDIQAWASGRIEPRQQLAALLRRLVNTTGIDLNRVDFPAYDNAERHGWDGYVEAGAATPWIPIGISGWEFGCNVAPEKKAQADYNARIKSLTAAERKNTTFIFVTPHNWPGKSAWEKARQAECKFRDVRAFDASDLEQWLEQSVATQTWFAELLGISEPGLRSLESCWKEWSEVTEPPMSKELFSGQLPAARDSLKSWLKNPTARPLVVTADSEAEALAFLHCVFEALDEVEDRFENRCVVIGSPAALQKASRASSNFIALITSSEAATAGLHRTQPVILVRPRSSMEDRPDIALDAVDDNSFQQGLLAMGIDGHEVTRWSRRSGQYPTILRRMLSTDPAIKIPPWSQDPALAQHIVRLGLAGAWVATKQADRDVVAAFFDGDYERVEEVIAQLRNVPQTPIWQAGNVVGVVSKADVLTACRASITKGIVDRFFNVAKTVLAEIDPALDLPEEDRWAAAIYGKSRNHSGTLRDGICESLVLLAVSGDKLFGQTFGINCRDRVDSLVHGLLTPFSERTWLSQGRDLQRYAEAAPEVFLDIVEDDLASQDPKILALMPAKGDALFGSCPRTGLLWALELLAWNPRHMLRVVEILARLSGIELTDNIGNKPEASLKSIFRWWMPQTAADVTQRIAALENLCKHHPAIGWRVCIGQLDSYSATGNLRPRWRQDDRGAGRVDQSAESRKFLLRAVDLALDWPTHNHRTLGDIVGHLHRLDEARQDRLWAAVAAWRGTGPEDQEKAALRERIRRHVHTRRGKQRKMDEASRSKARSVYDSLTPGDVVSRHQWLFTNAWVEESIDELEDGKYDYKKRQERIGALRIAALKEIWDAEGLEGFVRLCSSGNAASAAGWHLSHDVIASDDTVDVLLTLIANSSEEQARTIDAAIAGVLGGLEDDRTDEVLVRCIAALSKQGDDQGIIRLLISASFSGSTWRHVDALASDQRERYWTKVEPRWENQSTEEYQAAIAGLLQAKRPRAAFEFVAVDLDKIESEVLLDLLRAVATEGNEPTGTNLLSAHSIEEAIGILDERNDVAKDALASLEFIYIDAIEQTGGKVPNLERQLAESPIMYVQLLSYVYRRSDNGADPQEWQVSDPEAASALAQRAHTLLTHINRLPGTQPDGTVDEAALIAWIDETRRLAQLHGRLESADRMIGQLLYSKAQGADDIWPGEAAREALEHVRSKAMASGMAIATYNGRGAVWRGEGGQQERGLAETYRKFASGLAYSHPFVSQMLQQIVEFYERDAEREDASAAANRRLRR